MHDYDASDDDDDKKKSKSGKAIKEFECPDCDGENFPDDPITAGSEVRCNYCGAEFQVSFTDSGKMKLKEI